VIDHYLWKNTEGKRWLGWRCVPIHLYFMAQNCVDTNPRWSIRPDVIRGVETPSVNRANRAKHLRLLHGIFSIHLYQAIGILFNKSQSFRHVFTISDISRA
jgi:hypothetical protein